MRLTACQANLNIFINQLDPDTIEQIRQIENHFFFTGVKMKNVVRLLVFGMMALTLNGCFLTKVITVPMRVGGAVISIIPGVGDVAHDAIDETADVVDKAPI